MQKVCGDGMLPNGGPVPTKEGTQAMNEMHVFAFGPFKLIPACQSLLRGETRLAIGGRALDLLTALVEVAGDVVSKHELMARVWPTTTVDESNLKVNIAALRRLLGDNATQARYIATITGRGYRFIAPVLTRSAGIPPHPSIQSRMHSDLPADGLVPIPLAIAGPLAANPGSQPRVVDFAPHGSSGSVVHIEELCDRLGHGTIVDGNMMLQFGDTLVVLGPGSVVARRAADHSLQHLRAGCRILFCEPNTQSEVSLI
jgi:DNA-binding winged helix-turn-helix (wHTH) protein